MPSSAKRRAKPSINRCASYRTYASAPGPPRSPEAEPSLDCLRVQLHTLLGNDVYKTYRAEAAARHKEAAAKHQQQQGTAPGTPSAPQASAPSQVRTHPAAFSMHTRHIMTLGMLHPGTAGGGGRRARGCSQGAQRAQKEELELEPGAGGCWRRSGLESSQS